MLAVRPEGLVKGRPLLHLEEKEPGLVAGGVAQAAQQVPGVRVVPAHQIQLKNHRVLGQVQFDIFHHLPSGKGEDAHVVAPQSNVQVVTPKDWDGFAEGKGGRLAVLLNGHVHSGRLELPRSKAHHENGHVILEVKLPGLLFRQWDASSKESQLVSLGREGRAADLVRSLGPSRLSEQEREV